MERNGADQVKTDVISAVKKLEMERLIGPNLVGFNLGGPNSGRPY